MRKLLFVYFLLLLSKVVIAQVTPLELRGFLETSPRLNEISAERKAELLKFYKSGFYQLQWISDKANHEEILEIVESAADYGLEPEDYRKGINPDSIFFSTAEDSLFAETMVSETAIRFFNDLAYGVQPQLSYKGVKYKPSCFDIPSMLAFYTAAHRLPELADYLSLLPPEARYMLPAIRRYRKMMKTPGYKEEYISSSKTVTGNTPLMKKLFYLGIIDSIDKKLTEKELKKKISECQRLFNLLADGNLRSTALHELNIPLITRLKQLKLSLNYYRWLFCLAKQDSVIVVNIPAANLQVHHNGGVVLQMRLVVGKPATPTPTLSSWVNDVVLYPYWMVPHSIATKELLPAIKRNPGYLVRNNFQVLNAQGKVVNPYSVNWSALSPGNFPYRIRQSTGCDNALGLLKLDFYNPFSVYLHDTPNKSQFVLNKRFFSHGCMRMECPMDIGLLLLRDHRLAIDTLREDIIGKAPVVIPADQPMPVIVWYNPAGINVTGQVIFFEDIYKKFK